MTDAPERIWARKHPAKSNRHWHDATHDKEVADAANSALGTINPFVEYIRADKVAALVEALHPLLRFAENTESELGIVLDSADLARAALAAFKGGADGRQTP